MQLTTSKHTHNQNYYVLINTDSNASGYLPKLLESGGKSPWGNQNVNGYVRINVSTKPAEDRDGDGVYTNKDIPPLKESLEKLKEASENLVENLKKIEETPKEDIAENWINSIIF